MAWTKMQEKAIYTRGSNIIVSAGAGSGKTAVLSERILDYCLKGNDIRKLLVLTFTNAAALEMKERIRKKLLDNKLYEQANLLDSAYIMTFDAYSLALVKKYYYKLNLTKDIKIIDQALLSYYKEKFLTSLFNELYENRDENFFNLLKKYAKQNDDNIKKIVLGLTDKLALIVDEKKYYKEYEANYYNPNFIKSVLAEYEKSCLKAVNNLKVKLTDLYQEALEDQASQKLALALANILTNINANSYDELFPIISSLTLPRINPQALDCIKDLKTACATLIKDIKNTYFNKYSILALAETELYAIKDDVLYLLGLAMQLNSRLWEYKLEYMTFDYSDIAKLAIRLVKENQDILKEVSAGFEEILIDEYQDTSDIQEAFISLISHDNCYMVGDIKQSIYRFRNANPYIFKNKYTAYSQNSGGIKIDLNFNFRSRKEVINNLNLIFCDLMTNDCGDANYFEEHQMHFGQTEYENLKQEASFDMSILAYDSVADFSDDEVEAFICGREILKLINSKVKCLKGNVFEEVSFNDIAILIDKTKSFPIFKRVFEYLGIPLAIEADLDLTDSILPKLMANILTLIVGKYLNRLDKNYYHALASIARSFLFAYSDTEVFKLVNNGLENELTALIEELASKVDRLSLMDLYFLIIEKFKIYEKLYLIGDIDNNCVVLEYIYSLFADIHDQAMSIVEAEEYLKTVFDSEISLKYKLAKETSNSVHIMTIHKSKGLEFAYCFFPLLVSNFNQSDLKESFGLSNKYGIFIPYSDDSNSDTILKTLVKEEIRQADISEKVRLLYVALTRAREKMFLISNNCDYSEKTLTKTGFRSFNAMLKSLCFLNDYTCYVDTATLKLTKNYRINKGLKKLTGLEALQYSSYNYESEIKAQKPISKELKELLDGNLLKAIELGKQFHSALEVIDFNNPNIDLLPVDDFTKVCLKKILKLDVFKNIAFSKTYHEYEFYYKDYHGIIDLFCVYDDHVDIIDYKLSNTEAKEYLRQLAIYKEYIEANTNKQVNCYLLSILKQEVRKIL